MSATPLRLRGLLLVVLAAGLPSLPGLPAGPLAAAELTIGSPAPQLDIEHWFHDKEPITAFDPEKVYVIEFWATWCGPCIGSIPHLAELQAQHEDDLVVIGVSTEDVPTIEEFLEREKDGTTFDEITRGYWLTTDPDDSVSDAYMRAAGQGGIPTAFVVGRTGEIEWIGHPMRIDQPIAQILAGEWDREAYAREKAREEAEEQLAQQRFRMINQKIRTNDYDEALAMLDDLLAEIESENLKRALNGARQRIVRDAEEYAAQAATRGMDLDQQQEAIAGLIEMAFLLEAGRREDAAELIDGLLAGIKTTQIRELLEDARQRLEAESDQP